MCTSCFLFCHRLGLIVEFHAPYLILNLEEGTRGQEVNPSLRHVSIKRRFRRARPTISPISARTTARHLTIRRRLIRVISNYVLINARSHNVIRPFVQDNVISTRRGASINEELRRLLPSTFTHVKQNCLVTFFNSTLTIRTNGMKVNSRGRHVILRTQNDRRLPNP